MTLEERVQKLAQEIGLDIKNLKVTLKPSWISLCASSTSEPVKVGSTSDGDVIEYDNGASKYYRLLPVPYSASKDKFYNDWDGTNLSNLKASRII